MHTNSFGDIGRREKWIRRMESGRLMALNNTQCSCEQHNRRFNVQINENRRKTDASK